MVYTNMADEKIERMEIGACREFGAFGRKIAPHTTGLTLEQNAGKWHAQIQCGPYHSKQLPFICETF